MTLREQTEKGAGKERKTESPKRNWPEWPGTHTPKTPTKGEKKGVGRTRAKRGGTVNQTNSQGRLPKVRRLLIQKGEGNPAHPHRWSPAPDQLVQAEDLASMADSARRYTPSPSHRAWGTSPTC